MNKQKQKKDLDCLIKSCNLCPGLNLKRRTENASGYGNYNSRVFIVGQSLCDDCMRTQVPFTGGSGKILDKVFDRCGIRKSDIFITNIVHCHPPGNRPSLRTEIQNCRAFLTMELRIVNPLLIIALGRDAIVWSLGDLFTGSIGRHQGKMHKRFSSSTKSVIRILPMFHPAYLWRMKNSEEEKKYINKMVDVMKIWL